MFTRTSAGPRLLVGSLLGVCILSAAPDRIRSAPSGRSAVLQHSVHPKAQARFDTGAVDPAMRVEYATLLLRPAPGLEELLVSQQDPSSPDFHRWLTPEQFGDRFGLSVNDIAKMTAWLIGQRLTVNGVARGRNWISFSGTAAQVGRAFHTEIHRFQVDNQQHFAAARSLEIPAEFEAAISGVRGLDNFRHSPMYRLHTTSYSADYNSGNSHYLAPDDLSVIYNIAPLFQSGIDGTGQKIAILGQTDIDLTDIRKFRATANLPAADPQVVLVGPDPGTNSDMVEADLDLEWAGAIARKASLIFVTSTNVELSAIYAIDQNLAPVMSYSYGACEQEAFDILRGFAQQANAQGITWLASSGDSGAATCDDHAATPQAAKGLAVSYPASIPEITAVGGTEFNETGANFWGPNGANIGSALSYIPEMVWNDSVLINGLAGGGGGASLNYPKPVWQTGSGVPNDNARDVPDVSFAASAAHDGYLLVSGGRTLIVGGTSAASPVFAGMLALLNQSQLQNRKQTVAGLGNINPTLYRMAQAQSGVFHDITVGDNKVQCQQGSPNCVNGMMGYAATNSYDLATGLGSVDAFRMVSSWTTGSATTVTVFATPAALKPSDQVNVQVTVTGAGTPTGTVTLISNDVSLGTAVLNSGNASFSVAGALVAIGKGAITVLYSGDNTFAPSSGSLKIPLAITGALSYIIPSVVPYPVTQVGATWPYTLTLTQKADVATTITAFTIDGVNNLSSLATTTFSGTFSFSLGLAGRLSGPTTRLFHFAGMDASGVPWSVDLSVPFVGPTGVSISPGMTLTGTPSTVQQIPSADPACQWQQPLLVQETGGFGVSLTGLGVGTTDLSSSISQIFGTTRLAPYGTLSGSVCLSNLTVPVQKKFSLIGTGEEGSTIAASFTGSYAAPSASSNTMSVSPSAVTLAGNGSGNVNLSFGGGSHPWTATVTGAGRGKWLTVSPLSGTGLVALNLQANSAGLSNGVYNALVVIQSTDTVPQSIQIPVALVLNGTPNISVNGVNNAVSGAQTFAPGMWMGVYGTNLAPSTLIAGIVPFPLSLGGVSATVNGVSAPLWYVSSGQMNVQIPYETGAGPAILGINNNGSTTAFSFNVTPTAPGIVDTGLTGKAGQTIVAYVTGVGDVTPTLATGTIPPPGTKLSQFPQPRQPISMKVGSENANIVFEGIVNLVGGTQVNFTIPSDLKPGRYPVVVTVGAGVSLPVNVTVTP